MYSSRDPIPGDRLALWWAFVGVHPGLGELEMAADPRTQVAATDGTNCRLSVHFRLNGRAVGPSCCHFTRNGEVSMGNDLSGPTSTCSAVITRPLVWVLASVRLMAHRRLPKAIPCRSRLEIYEQVVPQSFPLPQTPL
jgi:hypothetical protein